MLEIGAHRIAVSDQHHLFVSAKVIEHSRRFVGGPQGRKLSKDPASLASRYHEQRVPAARFRG